MKKLKITASTSLDYKTDMMSEDDIKEYYERYSRLYAKTGKDKFLYMAGVLKDILRISNSDDQKVFEYYVDQLS